MVIQAVGLLDDLDKELNNYAMRLREWYGWHFPEVGKILPDNLTYAKVILKMGMRTNAKNIEFGTDLLTPEDEAHIKEAAEISMGSEISAEDELNIRELCTQIIFLTEYRQTLTEYLRTRMMTIAPNLTTMVGELVAARLISHAVSCFYSWSSKSKNKRKNIKIISFKMCFMHKSGCFRRKYRRRNRKKK